MDRRTEASTLHLSSHQLEIRKITLPWAWSSKDFRRFGRDNSYPRTAVSDGQVRLTLWQVDHQLAVESFNRRKNVGLHHLALEVDSEERLNALAKSVADWPEVKVEFMPELLGRGPRKHMMFFEPGGNRIELIWPGP